MARAPTSTSGLGLASGVGLVAANMIGAGVFLSAGFMAQELGPGPILLAWVAGAVLALCGAAAYGAAARLVPRSGGEYRYLSELLHPAAGYLAGWASLLVGFAAPIAVDALAAGAFAQSVIPWLDPRWTAAAFVTALTGFHASGFRASTRTQNALVAVKGLLLAAFVAVGLAAGARAWPDWRPPQGGEGFPVPAFAGSLFFVAFAYSGWNAAVYAAEEFREPERTVPRSMMVGTVLVALLYLLVNWIFVANLEPGAAFAAVTGPTGTLGHAVMARLAGPAAGAAWSGATVLVFLSAMSAMIFLGPRVYAAMAGDGFLPRWLAGRGGHPPRAAVLLQGALALLVVFTQGLRDALGQVGAILVLFAALTALGLVVARARGRTPAPSAAAVGGALAYLALSAWMFWKAFGESPRLLLWVGGAAAAGLVAWAISGRRAPAPR